MLTLLVEGPISYDTSRFALLIFSLAITGAAAWTDLSPCLDPSTKLDAGGDVSDKELAAARQACAQLQQSNLDPSTRIRVDHAASILSDNFFVRSGSVSPRIGVPCSVAGYPPGSVKGVYVRFQ